MGNNASRGMSEMVWISTAMRDPRHMRPFTNDLADNEGTGYLTVDTHDKNDAGYPLSSDAFPTMIWPSIYAKRTLKSLSDIFNGYGYWTVSARCADVLRQFDLGNGALYPVKVCQKDKVTPVGDLDWFCINFGNVKSALLVDESQNIEPWVQPGRWTEKYTWKDGDIALSPAALRGPDIWIEPSLERSLFLSAALGNALKKAKCVSGWGLLKCRIVDSGGGVA
jgi:hypothetical protein